MQNPSQSILRAGEFTASHRKASLCPIHGCAHPGGNPKEWNCSSDHPLFVFQLPLVFLKVSLGHWGVGWAREGWERGHRTQARGVCRAPWVLIPRVPVQDPNGNRIAQWREVTPRQGIVDLSLPLASEPALGTYTISVEGKSHSFSVEEYGTRGLGSGISPWAAGLDPLQSPRRCEMSLSWE